MRTSVSLTMADATLSSLLRAENINQERHLQIGQSDSDVLLTFVFWLCVIFFVVFMALTWFLVWRDNLVARQRRVAAETRNEDVLHTTRTVNVDFVKLLKSTTMVIGSQDLVHRSTTCLDETEDGVKSSSANSSVESCQKSKGGTKEEALEASLDVENGIPPYNTAEKQQHNNSERTQPILSESQHHSEAMMLQLPSKLLAPCLCAICLGTYKVEEQVSWAQSPEGSKNDSITTTTDACHHVFHTACMLQYAESAAQKNPERIVPCPLCRRPFVKWTNDMNNGAT